ncbi:MAG TPA: double-cubane-cluster-containing anaerobic reductase [Planctomycetota bacterium]|nr:double-cubane-cluster-containing anaerobic reductase [Planctomycetota bacterium]
MAAKDYTTMWESLGLNLEAHNGLLQVLGQAYGDIFLTQKSRPKGMQYLDFVLSEIHGLRVEELLKAKAEGRKVIGTFCLYVPEELILAVDGVCVGLCAGASVGTEQAERYLPRNTCALIKSFFGFKLAGLCPYTESCDLVIGETTCDGKKKAYEIFGEFKDTFVLEVPHMKGPEDKRLWLAELKRLAAKIEEVCGRAIAAEGLKRGIRTVNAKRAALQRLARLRRARPAPISGLDALLINQVAFYDDPPRFTAQVNAICDELEARIAKGEGVAPADAQRILVAGCPMAAPNWKVPAVVEQAGAVIVGEESCVGERGTRNLVAEDGETVDEMLAAIADRYLNIDCACFTPNTERLDHVVEMARDLQADGVVHYALLFCTPYLMEARGVRQRARDEGIPMLEVETDYSMEDMGQLATRVQAFLEVLRG